MQESPNSNSEFKVAADIMTKKPDVVHSAMTLLEVAQLFLQHNYSSAPVIGGGGEILGIIDEFALIKAKLHNQVTDESKDKVAHHLEDLISPMFVKEQTPIVDVMREMFKAPNHRVLVVNNAKNLIGIISPKDILAVLVGESKKAVDLKSQLEETQKALDVTSKQLETTKKKMDIYMDMVLENPNMIHSVGGDGRIIMANKKMHQNLGYVFGEMVGLGIDKLYPESVRGEAIQGLKKIMEQGYHKNTFTTMLRKNGEKVRVDIVSTALYDDDGKFLGTISVSRPVDADILLRALHGALHGEAALQGRYGALKDDPEVKRLADEVVAAEKAKAPKKE
jgi:PAS domain S-box-containing protein